MSAGSDNLEKSTGDFAIGRSGVPLKPYEHRIRAHWAPTAKIGLNLTAMIDVVFLLLVYFMAATEFKLGEEVYRLDLPVREERAQPVDPFALDEEPLRLRVTSTGFGEQSYTIRLDGPYLQPASFEELFDFLVQRQINSNTASGLFEADHPIIVEPTRTTQWDHVMETFNTAARARYTNVSFGKPR